MAAQKSLNSAPASRLHSDHDSELLNKISADGFTHPAPTLPPLTDDPSAQPTTPSDRLRPFLARGNSSGNISSASGASEYDFDAVRIDPSTVVAGSSGGGLHALATLEKPTRRSRGGLDALGAGDQRSPPLSGAGSERRGSISVKLERTGTKGRYLLRADDPEVREILRRGVERQLREQEGRKEIWRTRFSDLVFTRRFTAFDRRDPEAAGSVFHGFFTLFWLGVFLMLVKVGASNYRLYGSVLGSNEILTMMFRRDVLLLGITDGILCAIPVVCLGFQKAILKGWVSWNGTGWIIQNIWQSGYLGATIFWTIHRSWPWSHTVLIVLHCIVMLMKQHSYAFYNGYLSELYKRKQVLEKKLKELEELDRDDPISSTSPSAKAFVSSYFDTQNLESVHRRRPSSHAQDPQQLRGEKADIADIATAIESGAALTMTQVDSFERIIQLEVEGLQEELKGKCSDSANVYPCNLNLRDFVAYIPLPTVVYELEYPRQEQIDWWYVAEKVVATFGVIGVMIAVSQAFIYPVVMFTVEMKEQGMSVQQRLQEFPWVLSDLLFPFMMEYLLAWYVIWECILNLLAELTLFADRGFYADWWNSVSWDQFARDWNRPVHNFLLRHVYHSSLSAFKISRSSATVITFFLSACIHELVMWCIFKRLRGYLMAMQMMQLPLVMLSRTRWLKDRLLLGNVVFWVGIITGPSLLCSLYLIL